MVRLRKEHRVISEGKIEFLYPDNTDLLAYRRYGSADKEELLVLCNLTEQEIHAELPDAWATAEKLIGNYADNPSETLRPYECVVLHTTKEKKVKQQECLLRRQTLLLLFSHFLYERT